jgi:hypothetical protein
MKTDLGTTVLGGIMAAGTGAMPVVQMAQGNWDGSTIFQLVMSIGMALAGFFTGKGD